MAGYVRQSTAEIQPTLRIVASSFNKEFNALSDAFNGTTGHTHDGTAGNGPLIDLTNSVTGRLTAEHQSHFAADGNFMAITIDPTGNLTIGQSLVITRWAFSYQVDQVDNFVVNNDGLIEKGTIPIAQVIGDIPVGRITGLGDAALKNTGTTAGTLAAGNDTRIVNAVQTDRTITAGTGIEGGGNLSQNRTLSLNGATQASLALANSAVQPSALGTLAAKNKVDLGDINTTGTANNTRFLRGDGQWAIPAVTKSDVGLGDVDNTSDVNKPVSTAQQTALNLKANLASPSFTGVVSSSGEVRSASHNTFRLQGSSTSVFQRYDNTDWYLMFSDSVDGSFNALRPLRVNVSTGRVYMGHGLTVTGDVAASGGLSAYSDRRLKSEIEPLRHGLQRVKALTGYSYIKDGKKDIGVVAQEVQVVAPELVSEHDGYLAVNYGQLNALLIEAIKELSDRLDRLENR